MNSEDLQLHRDISCQLLVTAGFRAWSKPVRPCPLCGEAQGHRGHGGGGGSGQEVSLVHARQDMQQLRQLEEELPDPSVKA